MKNTRIRTFVMAIAAAGMLCTGSAFGAMKSGFEVNVMVDGSPRREYHSNRTIYIEAVRGKEYALRLTNPTSRRVAVALSVDGLNSINAKHTDASRAAKWVIAPYDTIEISGWQVDERAARRFYFTGERDSYGAALGQTENLGVIEAVFFEEKKKTGRFWPWERSEGESRRDSAAAPRSQGAGKSASPSAQSEAASDDDYAATGMGDKTRHKVRAVDLDLEDKPSASVRIRYEFRPQLVELGVLPVPDRPLRRRERASGFDDFCPQPGG